MRRKNKPEPVRLWPYLLLLLVISLLIGRFSLKRVVPQYPELPRSVDVVVLGNGITGASAALSAAEAGAEVFYIHLSEPDSGGFPAFSPAFWAARTEAQAGLGLEYPPETMAAEIFLLGEEAGDLSLIRRLSEASASSLAWVERLSGIPFLQVVLPEANPGLHMPDRGAAERFLPPEMIARAEARALEVSRQLQPERLMVENSRIVGIKVRDEAGNSEEIYSRAVILADGGYGSNMQMLKELANIEHVTARPEGGHDGVGLRLAMEAGAKTNHLDRVTLLPVFLPEGHSVPETGFPGVVAVTPSGQAVVAGPDLAQSLREAGGRLFIIHDAKTVPSSGEFTTIEDLMSLASGLGMDLASTVELTQGLTPPYYVAVVGTVALTPGGLAIDEKMRVLREEGILESLFAAGEITAGVHGTRAVPGFFFSESVTAGRLAGQEAAAWARR